MGKSRKVANLRDLALTYCGAHLGRKVKVQGIQKKTGVWHFQWV